MKPELRERLVHALEALETTQPPSFRAAFDLLAVYLPGVPPLQDSDLAARFRKVIDIIEAAKRDERTLKNLPLSPSEH